MMKALKFYLQILIIAHFAFLFSCSSGSDTSNNPPSSTSDNTSIANSVKNGLTMSGTDTSTIGTWFPVTSAKNENANTIYIEASSCAIKPQDVCAFLGTLILSFNDNGEITLVSLMWGQDNALFYVYSLSCFPQSCNQKGVISVDASTQSISFNQLELAVSLGNKNAAGPITLDGSITLSNITLPSPAATPTTSPGSNTTNVGSITVTGADMNSQPFSFNGEFIPISVSADISSTIVLQWGNNYFTDGYSLALVYKDLSAINTSWGKTLILSLTSANASQAYIYYSDCTTATSSCDGISIDTAAQTVSFNNVVIPVDSRTSGVPIPNTMATSAVTISGQLSINPSDY